MKTVLAGALAVLLSSAATLAQSIPQPPPPKSGAHLTCSKIARECRRECPKEAPADFCLGYCQQERADCLATGHWDGLARNYTGVKRE